MDFLKLAENIQEELVALRRDFHQYPETGYNEVRTSAKIKEFLDKDGIEYTETAKTGICAVIYGSGEKTIGIRADIDALPVQEKNQCEYSSKTDGMMHACGHDAHTTILLGVGKVLNSIKSELKGNVKLLFEPAEETTGGAKLMIAEGVLENPKVDAVIGLHVNETMPAGKIGIKSGVVNAASNPFTIRIIGKGGHGAGPDATIDPIVISSHVVLALQNIVSRELPPTSPAVVTVGSIHGGSAQNIIPEEVVISGIIRTMETKHRLYVKKRLTEITEGIVHAMRGKCVIDIEESYPCLYNDDNMVDLLREAAEKTIGADNIVKIEIPTMGVESFAYFSMERPSAFYFLGCGNEEKGITYPLHNSRFDIDEHCLATGVAVQCSLAYEFLLKNVNE
jgi:amidohydrolase